MPIKIFAAPGDHRDDFTKMEQQVNAWIAKTRPRIVSLHPTVNQTHEKRDHGGFMMTLVVHYEEAAA
ncbi:MAG: hypothetical protein JSU63_12260 [Phycisphaerales bacterium]|nr:MAG: hypothetical protein JSU63_12260 [Phycisphaerales bacterium]